MRTPPWPVAVAAGLYALLCVSLLAIGVSVLFADDAGGWGFTIVALVAAAVPALLAHGLWRGYRGARVVACIFAVVGLVTGLQRLGEGDLFGLALIAVHAFIAVAVTVPRASRAWFTPPA
ncbi:hypothetical protein ACPPVO_31410 [Dactylosporangium sp. McL0621]|uniref:hypothetical protein n=1 Tax=Dactylosporangium sp. McL0621 TaxID=3415678 RepID=UPI003CE90270